MSILVVVENINPKINKSALELVSYGASLGSILTCEVVVASFNIEPDQLSTFGGYGATQGFAINHSLLGEFDNKVSAIAISQLAEKVGAKVILFSDSHFGKALAPRLSIILNAGLVLGVLEMPVGINPLIFPKKTFTGKAFSNVKINSEKAVVTLPPNIYKVNENKKEITLNKFEPQLEQSQKQTYIKDRAKQDGKTILTEAEIVVSGGRGMKSAENWGQLEELADVLDAGLACSRPVADDNWRPEEEHVGQTGKVISPNLYFAFGISGAIQHVGGISSSKCIVAVNKDSEAPIFKVADYGIVGDVNKVIPKLIESIRILKEQ
ncbi:MAG: electron transfer flavoprotein subunit alpha/FixB family protein [Hyphomicrobiales bacterium]